MSTLSEIEQTFEALKVILSDDETFHHVCTEVFKTIDVDNSGKLDKKEIRNFIDNICQEMGMEHNPDDDTIAEVFNELDRDNSNDISIEEMKHFLRRIFVGQHDEIARALNR
jgi:Ca2+-binding EF-hand superfamily protein